MCFESVDETILVGVEDTKQSLHQNVELVLFSGHYTVQHVTNFLQFIELETESFGHVVEGFPEPLAGDAGEVDKGLNNVHDGGLAYLLPHWVEVERREVVGFDSVRLEIRPWEDQNAWIVGGIENFTILQAEEDGVLDGA